MHTPMAVVWVKQRYQIQNVTQDDTALGDPKDAELVGNIEVMHSFTHEILFGYGKLLGRQKWGYAFPYSWSNM